MLELEGLGVRLRGSFGHGEGESGGVGAGWQEFCCISHNARNFIEKTRYQLKIEFEIIAGRWMMTDMLRYVGKIESTVEDGFRLCCKDGSTIDVKATPGDVMTGVHVNDDVEVVGVWPGQLGNTTHPIFSARHISKVRDA
ncbi:MAG: hypothetical protein ACR2RA_03180 [Geminicoccaceae bacterium]